MNDRPEDDGDIENEDDAAGDSQLSGEDEHEVVPSWQVPGMEAYLRSVANPILKQVGAFDHIAKIAASAMPKFDVPRFDLPELRLSVELTQSFAADIERALAPMREAVASMVDWSKLVESFVDPSVFERIRKLVSRRMPPNWSELDDWRRGTTFIEQTGWAIVWLPRYEVVSALLAASPHERESVLVAYSPELVDDAGECARSVRHADLRFLGECVAEIADSIRAGRHRAAQALAASVLTELIQGILGHKKLAEVHSEYGKPWEEESIQLLRFALITSTIPVALSNFFRDNGDPMPSSFNRHAVAHGASPVQFTEVNALVGLLLVAALTRELQELYDEGLLPDDE